MKQNIKPSLQDLTNGVKIENLKLIAKGLEYRIYISSNRRYVIKVPRIYSRFLGIIDSLNIEGNIKQCKIYITENNLSIEIPLTIVERYKKTFVIIQEYIEGDFNEKLTKRITENIEHLAIEENFIDLRAENILYSEGKPYLIDVSGGFYYNFARKFGKRTSKLLWHFLQIIKLFYKRSGHINYQEDKTYIDLEFAKLLKSLNRNKIYCKRIRILLWHLSKIYKLFSSS